MRTAAPIPVVLVRAASLTVALPLGAVVETMRPLPVRPLAEPPPFVAGVAIIRGAPVPVVDLATLLGAAPDERPTRFVTIAVGQRLVALAVAAVRGLGAIDDARCGPLPPLLAAASARAVAALAALDGELVALLDAARIVPEDLLATLDPTEAAP